MTCYLTDEIPRHKVKLQQTTSNSKTISLKELAITGESSLGMPVTNTIEKSEVI